MSGPDLWTADDAAADERLDRFLAARYDLPRSQVQRWIRDGRVTSGGATLKASHPLRPGEVIACVPPPPTAEVRVLPEPSELVVLYEDADLVVIDKPAGLTVHPGAGRSTGTLAHRLLARYPEMAGVGGPGRPGIVHRLDKDTTGLILAARNARAHHRLAAAFAQRRVDKRYLAVVYGRPTAAHGRIEQPIGRHPRQRQRMTVRPDGRPAVTDYRLLAATSAVSLLEVLLGTGRTHQIRVHLKAVGHPLVGDPVYGEERWAALPPRLRRPLREFPRPALHAWRLGLSHPSSGLTLRFEAAPPLDLVELWREVAGEELAARLPAPPP